MKQKQRFGFSTNEVAQLQGVKPESLHRALSKNGNYLGMTPVKTENGRLLWPVGQVAVLFGQGDPVTVMQAARVLCDKGAYCTSASDRAFMDRDEALSAFTEVIDAVLGFGQSLGLIPMQADAGKVLELVGVCHVK